MNDPAPSREGPNGAMVSPAEVGAGCARGSRSGPRVIALAPLRSVAGGGDTVSALRHAGVSDRMSYVSTAGGAFLEWLEGKTLPGVAALG